MLLYDMEIAHLYISRGHNFFGRHGLDPEDFAAIEVETIDCVAGRGIRGDRFFDYKNDYKGQITFFAEEVFADLCRCFRRQDLSPSIVRRNIITRNQDLNELIGMNFEVQGVAFAGIEECRPCYWMDRAIGAGARDFLRGRGGLRARIVRTGQLRIECPALAK